MSSTEAAARERIQRQIEQLHGYHLEVKHKITEKEAEVRKMLGELLASKKFAARQVVMAEVAHERTLRKSVGTSPHKAPLSHVRAPTNSQATNTQQNPTALGSADPPTAQDRNRSHAPTLRIKGNLPPEPSVSEPAPFPSNPFPSDMNFLLGATDSLSLMLTNERRKLGGPVLAATRSHDPSQGCLFQRHGNSDRCASSASGSTAYLKPLPGTIAQAEDMDSITLSPIGKASGNEDRSFLEAPRSLRSHNAVPQKRWDPILSVHARPTPLALVSIPVNEPKRVRFSSKSPQVELFSVERPPQETLDEPRPKLAAGTCEEAAEVSPAPVTVTEPKPRSSRCLGNVLWEPETQPAEVTGNTPRMDTVAPLRNSVHELMSTLKSVRNSLQECSRGHSSVTCNGDLSEKEATTPARSDRSTVSLVDHDDESEEAATPSPRRKSFRSEPSHGSDAEASDWEVPVEAPAAVTRADGERAVKPFSSLSPELPCGMPDTQKVSDNSQALLEATALSPIFLQRSRAKAPPMGAPVVSHAIFAPTTRHSSAAEKSLAVHLSNVSLKQATSFLNRRRRPLASARRHQAPLLSGTQKASLAMRRSTILTERSSRRPRRPNDALAPRTVPEDDATFESQPVEEPNDDGGASSAPISLACGPTLYFN